jgi:hypothetical protein
MFQTYLHTENVHAILTAFTPAASIKFCKPWRLQVQIIDDDNNIPLLSLWLGAHSAPEAL